MNEKYMGQYLILNINNETFKTLALEQCEKSLYRKLEVVLSKIRLDDKHKLLL